MTNLILVGFSLTGKSEVGRMAAERLGLPFVETDDAIAALAGKPVPRIFAKDGEPAFRALERQVVAQACRKHPQVIATGGGAVLDPDNRAAMLKSGVVICLGAKPDTIHRRLQRQLRSSRARAVRPLLEGGDPLKRIQALKVEREPYYALADWTIQTDHLSLEQVVDEVLRAYDLLKAKAKGRSRVAIMFPPADVRPAPPPPAFPGASFVVRTATATCPGYVGWGLLDHLGERLKQLGLKGAAYVITDSSVFSHYGERALTSLKAAGFEADAFVVPAGEASKSLEQAERIYDWLAQRRAERGHAIVALGGGVSGDLGGFVAATYLRGLPLVQTPTSLLAMVDAAVGGKVAVNLPVGKNLVGAFYQPRMVLADTQTLTTLPPRELTSGWSEVVKHGLILDASLFDRIEGHIDEMKRLDRDLASQVVERSMAIKADVVNQDERETLGIRTILNYGHTIAHAIEAASSYEAYLHGEAVSVGMMGAARIGVEMGVTPPAVLDRQERVLRKFGLPLACPGLDPDAILHAMSLDKKVVGKAIRWVLLQDVGGATVRGDVPQDLVARTVHSLTNP